MSILDNRFVKASILIYAIYVALLLIFMGLVAYTPMLALDNEEAAEPLYSVFASACHQKISRSTCLFADGRIDDCTPQEGAYVADDRDVISVESNGVIGYKYPICARDIGLYGFMLIGAFAYAFVYKLDEKKMLPPILLVVAIIPIAMDGGIQFLSDIGIHLLGFEYESANITRIVTGGIAGFAVSFYVIPILNRMFGK